MKFLTCDESWRNMSALHWHFQSTVLPGPLGWYAHWITSNLPFIGHLGVAFTFVAECAIPFLIFMPNRTWRYLAFASNTALQLGIGATGNYGTFNVLTAALGLSI